MGNNEKHFVLVHGAGFGSWSWYKLVALLKSNGQKVTAIDLAGSGIDPIREEDVKSFSQYADPLMKFMSALPPEENVVLVGHSSGGAVISKAMENYPNKVSTAVFLAAVMPGPDIGMFIISQEHEKQLGSLMDCQFWYSNGKNNPPTSFAYGPEFLSTKMLQLSPPEDFSLATLLVRPVSASLEEVSATETFTKENYGSVRRVSLITEKDNLSKLDFQKWMIGKNPPDEVKTLEGTDHMAMLSNPQGLCQLLLEI